MIVTVIRQPLIIGIVAGTSICIPDLETTCVMRCGGASLSGGAKTGWA